MRILVDTSILVRLVRGPDDAHFEVTVAALEMLRSRRDVPVVVPQNLYEFWVVATRPVENNGLGLSPQEANDELTAFGTPLFRRLLDERGILPHWQDVVVANSVRGKLAHDARLVAAMYRHGITTLLTLNSADFARFSGITAMTPHQVVGESP
ncbi:MAG: PIN domain-containing protein [Planctomycetaceae bacterium]|nr:PIN domain-containing protein [Planctomycetaceae bacterium]